MTTAEWIAVGDGWRHGPFLVAPLRTFDKNVWKLGTVADASELFVRSPADMEYENLASAKAFALHYELVSVRRTKRFRHGALLPLFATLGVLFIAATSGEQTTVPMFTRLVGLAFCLLAVREAAYLISAWAASWDYYYEMPSLSAMDFAVRRIATTVGTARQRRRTLMPTEGTVKIVPIDPDVSW